MTHPDLTKMMNWAARKMSMVPSQYADTVQATDATPITCSFAIALPPTPEEVMSLGASCTEAAWIGPLMAAAEGNLTNPLPAWDAEAGALRDVDILEGSLLLTKSMAFGWQSLNFDRSLDVDTWKALKSVGPFPAPRNQNVNQQLATWHASIQSNGWPAISRKAAA
eukprot:1692308-Amphidinium_carterae.1